MKKRALIGHTGFVGGNLLLQGKFDSVFSSSDIDDMRGQEYDEVYCAGAPGLKWLANKEPEQDAKAISKLIESLRLTKIKKLILISTVDVYKSPNNVDEQTIIDESLLEPYGRHRHQLEKFASDYYSTLIIRLPGLFGRGLKKNLIFDLIHGRNINGVDSRAQFQFYSLLHLTEDIKKAESLGLTHLNIATEPVTIEELIKFIYHRNWVNHLSDQYARYDMRTIHGTSWGNLDGYLYSKQSILDELKDFIHGFN